MPCLMTRKKSFLCVGSCDYRNESFIGRKTSITPPKEGCKQSGFSFVEVLIATIIVSSVSWILLGTFRQQYVGWRTERRQIKEKQDAEILKAYLDRAAVISSQFSSHANVLPNHFGGNDAISVIQAVPELASRVKDAKHLAGSLLLVNSCAAEGDFRAWLGLSIDGPIYLRGQAPGRGCREFTVQPSAIEAAIRGEFDSKDALASTANIRTIVPIAEHWLLYLDHNYILRYWSPITGERQPLSTGFSAVSFVAENKGEGSFDLLVTYQFRESKTAQSFRLRLGAASLSTYLEMVL